MSFYASEFDPRLIVGQMSLMQALHYLSLSLLVFLGHEVAGATSEVLTVRQVFSYRAMGAAPVEERAWTASTFAFATVLNGLLVGVALYFVVERTKKCLDFAATVYILHLAACWWYGGFPWEWRWWVANGLALTIAAVSGEWLCFRKDMREISTSDFLVTRPAGGAASNGGSSSSSSSSSSSMAAASSHNAAAAARHVMAASSPPPPPPPAVSQAIEDATSSSRTTGAKLSQRLSVVARSASQAGGGGPSSSAATLSSQSGVNPDGRQASGLMILSGKGGGLADGSDLV